MDSSLPKKLKEPLTKEQEHQTLFKVLSKIQDSWQFADTEIRQMIHCKKSTFSRWKTNESIPVNKGDVEFELIIHFFAIQRSLRLMFPNPKDQVGWLKAAGHKYYQDAPMSVITESVSGLIEIRRYLDYVRGLGS